MTDGNPHEFVGPHGQGKVDRSIFDGRRLTTSSCLKVDGSNIIGSGNMCRNMVYFRNLTSPTYDSSAMDYPNQWQKQLNTLSHFFMSVFWYHNMLNVHTGEKNTIHIAVSCIWAKIHKAAEHHLVQNLIIDMPMRHKLDGWPTNFPTAPDFKQTIRSRMQKLIPNTYPKPFPNT